KKDKAVFSYDAFPLFWRMSLDQKWNHRRVGDLLVKMNSFFEQEWKLRRKFVDRYTIDGMPDSKIEALPLYATVHALAETVTSSLTENLKREHVDPLLETGLSVVDRFALEVDPVTDLKALPIYATVQSLAQKEAPPLADDLKTEKLDPLFQSTLS